jgi:hypothetical protein
LALVVDPTEQGAWGLVIGISQVGHRLPPNLVIAETIGRTEGLLLHREWVRIVRLTGYGTRSVTTAA